MIPIYRAFAYPVKLVVYRETWDHIGTVKEITFHTTPRREMIRALRAVEAAIASHPQLKVTLNDALGRAMLDE